MADPKQETRWDEEFLKRILQIDEHEKKENHYNVMTKETYDKLVGEIEEAQLADKKTQKQYRRLNRFKVINICGTRRLVTKKDPMKYYLYVDEIFDIIEAAHVAVGHGGRDRLKTETSRIYANITIEMINIFLSMCETCQHKKSLKKGGLVTKPILHPEMNSRCRFDLIDMQMQEDRGFKFIMVYHDHLTKFVLLRALQSKRAVELAHQLTGIFLTFGAPCILHSDSGREFVNSVINELALFWPECKLVYGKPRHSHSQGSVVRSNQDIEIMLASWMQENNTTKWSNGIGFVQFTKNRALHSGIKQSPYKAMFGTEPRVGLMTSRLPLDVIKEIRDEDDLIEALNKNFVKGEENLAPYDVEILQGSEEVKAVASSSGQSHITATPRQEYSKALASIRGQSPIPAAVKQEDSEALASTRGHSPITATAKQKDSQAVASTRGQSPITAAARQEDSKALASTSAESQIILMTTAGDNDPEAIANVNRPSQITAAARQTARENLTKQAKRMKLASDSIHAHVQNSDNTSIPISDIDGAKADLGNVIGVVLQRDEEDVCKIGMKYGILDKLYCRSESGESRECQGFDRCVCKKAYMSKRCLCNKKGVLRNSICHDSLPCNNK